MDSSPYSPPQSTEPNRPRGGLTLVSLRQWLVGVACILLAMAAVTAAILLLVWVLGLAGFSVAFAFSALVAIGLIGSLASMLAAELSGRRARGSKLLDCGPHSGHLGLLCCGLGMLLVAFVAAFRPKMRLPLAAVMTYFGIFCLYMSTTRLAVFENGIWTHTSLLRWRKVKNYRWKDTTLIIETSRFLPVFGQAAFRVSQEQRPAFQRLLDENTQCPPGNRQDSIPPE